MSLADIFGLATKKDILRVEEEKKQLNGQLETALTQLSGYQTTLYGWLNNGQPVQLADNTFTYIQAGYQMNADVFTCVDLILTKLCQCGVNVYEVSKDKTSQVQKYRNLLQSDTAEARIKARAIELKAMKETYFPPISDLLMTPNKLQSWGDWLRNYAGFYLLTGNSYNYYNGINPANRKWGEMYVLPAQFMQIISGGPMQPVKGYRVINQRFFGSDMFDFEATSVSHLKSFNPNYNNYGSQLYGQSPLMAYRMTLQKNKDTRIEGNKQVVNGGPLGIVSPKDGNTKWTADQGQDFKDQLMKKNRYSGGDVVDRLFASGTPIEFQQIGLAVADMMLLESLNFDRKDIANAYHIPITLLNDMSASTDNNVSAHMKQFIYNVIIPLANMISDKLTRDICPPYNTNGKTYVIQIDPTTLPDMQDDMTKVATWFNTAWWTTANQKLQGMGFETSTEPNMDKVLVPNNMMLIDDLSVTDAQFTQAAGMAAPGKL